MLNLVDEAKQAFRAAKLTVSHAFDFRKNTNHPSDIALLGTRYPYTYNMVALEDRDFLFSARVSEGVGFADAIFVYRPDALGPH